VRKGGGRNRNRHEIFNWKRNFGRRELVAQLWYACSILRCYYWERKFVLLFNRRPTKGYRTCIPLLQNHHYLGGLEVS
jgi:Trm5-related predicted tRNA methylase